MYAFECAERLLPSTTNNFFSGNDRDEAKSSILVRKDPSSKGVYLLNNGAIKIGYIVSMTSDSTNINVHRYIAMAGPVCSSMYTMAAIIGGAMTKVKTMDFIKSVTNVIGVVLLKPCFASIWNVLYTDHGSAMKELITVSNKTQLMLCLISPSHPKYEIRDPATLQEYG